MNRFSIIYIVAYVDSCRNLSQPYEWQCNVKIADPVTGGPKQHRQLPIAGLVVHTPLHY